MTMNRGDIYWVNLSPSQGSEIRKKRPCVVLGATPINQARRTVVVVPLSTSAKAFPPVTIPVSSLKKTVVAVCDQVRAVDKRRLLNKAGTLSQQDLERLEQGLRQVLVL